MPHFWRDYIMIALFLAPVYLLLNGYILLWFYSWTEACSESLRSLWFRIPITLLYLFLSTSPLTGLFITRAPLHRILKIIANYWLGTLEYILIFVLLFDAVRRITGLSFMTRYRYPALLHTWPRSLLIFGGLAVFLVTAVSLYGIFHAKQIYVSRYSISVEKECAVPELKIALIADLHLGYNSTEAHVQRLVHTINAEKPDLICIAGDFFDNEYDAIKDPEAVAACLAGLNSTYGTYGCYGNHDVSEKILAGFTFPHRGALTRDRRFSQFLEAAGIRLLEDEAFLIDNGFYLAGRKDPDMAKKEHDSRLSYSALTAQMEPSMPVIVLDHQPKELDEWAAAGVDLVLSGHTHAGQMFPANLLMPLIWENPWGLKKKGTMYSVVTSGAGVWGPAMRVGTNNEVVILDVTFGKEA